MTQYVFVHVYCYLMESILFFSLFPFSCPLSLSLSYFVVAKSLSYIRLKDLVSRNPSLIPVALNRICFLLHSVSCSAFSPSLSPPLSPPSKICIFPLFLSPPSLSQEISHSQDYGQREVLLPLVLLLKELMIIVSNMCVNLYLYSMNLFVCVLMVIPFN